MSSNFRVLPPDDSGPSLLGLLYSWFTGGLQGMVDSVGNKNPKFPPLEVLPCANVNLEKLDACKEPGRLACSSCKLVSYCSKGCQMAHWVTHKRDCKDPIRSSSWMPGWVLEGRNPSFLTGSRISASEEFANRFRNRFSIGSSLWGNVPATDIVNLRNNEKDLKADLSLAFAASGDIRNIVTTINALGPDYSGTLNILLNDMDPSVSSRNITLLLILGTIPDEVIAAEMALHFWYSAFMPSEYRFRILSTVLAFMKKEDSEGKIFASLGPHSTLACLVSSEVKRLLVENVRPAMSLDQAQDEYKRVRNAPSRVDLRDRMYMGLKPSHRLAFLEYRRFGIILPFGAVNAHFNVPNPSLFSDGVWLQTDYADPLESWDIDKVFDAGKAHGAQPEDVYGCLYFFLSDQLRAFSRHIRQHRISFHVLDTEACALAEGISRGVLTEYGFPPTTRFDRIDVSNIMDPNYVGIRDVTNAWGPLLARTDNAALVGYFMNWVACAEKGRVVDAGMTVFRDILDSMIDNNRTCPNVGPVLAAYLASDDSNAMYDNSAAFSKFWKENGGANVKLQMRSVHRIVPHRLKCAIDARPNALPDFVDDETWYRYVRLVSFTWWERFVELRHSSGRAR